MPNVLMIAYHFPPSAVSSGHLRTLALTRYLPQFGWEPIVLSAHRRAYGRTDERLLAEVGHGVPVTHAFALDTRKHLSLWGSYPVVLAQPDRWVSWWLGAVPAGLKLVRRYRPKILWSTYPIMTAHLIAYTLHRLTGIPWVADFRDPVSTSDLGYSRVTAATRRWVERRTIKCAANSVFTTPGAMADCGERYPARKTSMVVIPNGYDERNFDALKDGPATEPGAPATPITLVHSGGLYRDGRNPGPFLRALAELRKKRIVAPQSLQIILRASGNKGEYEAMVRELGLEDMVSLPAAISHDDALAEQASAGGLLLFQGSVFNRQIPAKVYEYLRVGRPIFALIDKQGDTAALLRSEGIDTMASIEDASEIAIALESFLESVAEGGIVMPSSECVARYSRVAGAKRVANLFDQIVGG